MGSLGIILVCFSALAEHCQMIKSPYVFKTAEECQAEVIKEATKIKAQYEYATLALDCVKLKYNGEPA